MRLPSLKPAFLAFFFVAIYFPSFSQGNYVSFSSIPKDGTILIYSHLDDDLIWMLPFWKISEKFIGGAMPSTLSFKTVISQQQALMDAGGYNISYQPNWYTPWDDITDTEYTEYYWAANPSYSYLVNDHLETRLSSNRTELSRSEINKIKAKLEQYFADPSMSRVITHNNWGEYGHAHHRGINKAVRELAVKYRRDVWMLGCNNGEFIDVSVPPGITYTLGSFNMPTLYTGIRTIYVNNRRWSWYTDRIPAGDHRFIKIVDTGNDKSNLLTGDEITYPGPSQLEPGAYIFDGADDYLTLKGNQYHAFTISMRIRPEEIKAMDIAQMSEYPGSPTSDRNIFLDAEGKLVARILDGSQKVVISSNTIPAGLWTHIAVTSDGSTLKIFINGSPDNSVSAGSAITGFVTPEFILGLASVTSSCFKGQISSVRLYDRVLSDNEIARISGAGFTIISSAGAGGTINPSGSVAIPAGTDFAFTIEPDNNYRVSQVRVDNTPLGPLTSYRFSNVLANHTISASFSRISFPVSAGTSAGGRIDPAGDIQVSWGATQSFSIIPDEGYRVSDVLVDNSFVGPVKSYSFSNVTSEHTIQALFTPIELRMESSTGEGGQISPNGNYTVFYGNDISYSITPNQGFRIADVTVDNVSVGAVPTYTLKNISADHFISVLFEPITFSITCLAGKGGSVSPAGTTIVKYGSAQEYTFSPHYGYKTDAVILDGIPVEAGPGPFRIENVKADHTLSIIFEPLRTFNIEAGNPVGGSIDPPGNLSYFEGTDQTYTLTPRQGFRIAEVIIDSVRLGPVDDYTFKNISSGHSITAVFTSEIGVKLYPNPLRTTLSVEVRSPYDDHCSLYLTDMADRIVFNEPDIPVNTIITVNPGIRPGIYLVNLYVRGKRIGSWKVVKY